MTVAVYIYPEREQKEAGADVNTSFCSEKLRKPKAAGGDVNDSCLINPERESRKKLELMSTPTSVHRNRQRRKQLLEEMPTNLPVNPERESRNQLDVMLISPSVNKL